MANNEPVINKENEELQKTEQTTPEATQDSKPENTQENPETKAETSQSSEEIPKEEPKTEEAPKDKEEPKVEEAASESKTEEKAEEVKPETPNEPNEDQKKKDVAFEELKKAKENNEKIEVFVESRIKGGLRAQYKELPIFLPASHLTLRRNPAEELLQDAIGKNITVVIHEVQEDQNGRKTIIVTRRPLLEGEFWDNINVGDVKEGVVSSIAKFGAFVDLGGYEGLIHISRLSHGRVEDPKDVIKKGETVKTVVVEVNKEKKRIALSRQEFVDSPWKNVENEFQPGTKVEGKIKKIVDFGAYIELKEGVEGLLRTSELSWTKRVKNPGVMFNEGDTITVEVISANEEKQNLALSYKRTLDNPWNELKDKYSVGSETKGIVTQVITQGAVINLNDEVDGFMPRSKMRGIIKDNKIPFKVGDEVEVTISDLVPEQESLIFSPTGVEEQQGGRRQGGGRPPQGGAPGGRKFTESKADENQGSFSLGDLLADATKENLFDKVQK